MSAAEVLSTGYEASTAYVNKQGRDSDLRATLLVTTVDIGDGLAARIEVRQGDDPVDVARAFCVRHGLPESIIIPLAQHLEDNLAETGTHVGVPTSADASCNEGLGDDAAEESEDDDGYGDTRGMFPLAVRSSNVVEPAAPGRHASAGGEASMPPSSTSANTKCETGAYESQPNRQAPHHLQVEPSSHSDGMLGARPPALVDQAGPRPQTADAAIGMLPRGEHQGPLSYRPASIRSARGAEYFNHGPGSSRSVGSDSSLHYRSAGQLPAHSRLYADHFRKQQRLEEERRLRDLEIQLKTEQVHIAPASNKLASHRTAGSYRNYGERLYVEGRLEAMKKEQLSQRVKEEEARSELEQYTFQPEISKMAQQIKQGETERGTMAGTAYQRLYQRGATAKRQERMDAIRQEQDDAEVRECSFRPQINGKSARMVEQRQHILKESGIAGYEQLYNDSMRRQTKLQQLAARLPEEATFRPQVNTSSVVLKKLLEGRQGDASLGGSCDVAIRLLERGRKYEEKLQQARRMLDEQPRDAATGQPLFRPKTHRAPQYERNPEGAPIGEYLYSIKAEWDERAARVANATQRRNQRDASSTFVNSRSERLVDRLKRERFRAIFDYLRRGQPAPVLNLLETVQDETFMDTIDPEVRADIEYAGRTLAKAIARRQRAELQDSATSAPDSSRGSSAAFAQSTNGELDAGGFVALMEDVMARTKGLTRQYLLPLPSTRQKFEQPTFRPAIDPHSLALASRRRPESLPAYELLYKTAEEQAAKREMMRRAAEEAKLKECLFHPVIFAQPKAKEGRAIKRAEELRGKRTTDSEAAAAAAAKPIGDMAKQGQQQAGPGAGTGATAGRSSAKGVAAVDVGAAAQHVSNGGTGGEEGGDGGGELHFEALECQINDALVRLSLSEQQVAASLRQAAAAEPLPPLEVPPAISQSIDANGYRLDCRAICGTPDLIPPPDCCGTTGTASSLAGFNPLDDVEGSGEAALAQSHAARVAWAHNSQEVVAQVLDSDGNSGSEELAGLDLHALASTDLPQHTEPTVGRLEALTV